MLLWSLGYDLYLNTFPAEGVCTDDKIAPNVYIFILFFNIFEIHHEKYVQISTNMTSIGLEIHEVRRFSIKNMVLKMAACISI